MDDRKRMSVVSLHSKKEASAFARLSKKDKVRRQNRSARKHFFFFVIPVCVRSFPTPFAGACVCGKRQQLSNCQISRSEILCSVNCDSMSGPSPVFVLLQKTSVVGNTNSSLCDCHNFEDYSGGEGFIYA